MRQLIEKQMEQLSLERLRGSPARAAAYEALLEFGCEDVLAQAVAARIDPRLEPAQILEPMLAELARMLTVARSETIDDGGVIALVGPTGSGKTTTAAKLAARFAARHRARDVALVTIDGERAGAREQLHAHGRRLGITVCEAAGPDGLQAALAQLTDYPLVIVDTPGFAPRDRGLFGQILWLHQSRNVRSLLVLPANAHPHDLSEVVRRYGPAAPEGVVLTKVDEAGRMGSALSVAVRHGLTLAYTTHGQNVPDDIDTADATRLAKTLEKVRRAADNPLATEERHAVA
jgi:flagellar biosynthesis protein FlhF